MGRFLLVGIAVATLFCSSTLQAGVITIDFEGLPDSTSIGALYALQGVTFSSGIIAVSGAFGGSLNEVDFPPVPPGQAAFINEADTTALVFSQPILTFSGYFTYGGPITLNFYNAGSTLLTTLTSGFSTNAGTSGGPGSPNELLAAANLADAIRVEILAPGTDVTMDDLTFTTGATVVVPEPATGLLLTAALGISFVFARRVRR